MTGVQAGQVGQVDGRPVANGGRFESAPVPDDALV